MLWRVPSHAGEQQQGGQTEELAIKERQRMRNNIWTAEARDLVCVRLATICMTEERDSHAYRYNGMVTSIPV